MKIHPNFATLLALLLPLTTMSYAWDIQDNISTKQAQEIVNAFLLLKDENQKRDERQAICNYIINDALGQVEASPQTINILLDALKPSQTSMRNLVPLLPWELQAYILSFLPYKYRCTARGVSKKFREMIDQNTWTEQELDFCKEHYAKTPLQFTNIPGLAVSHYELESLIPYANVIWNLRIQWADDDALKLLDQFPNLTTLDLVNCDTAGTDFKYLSELKSLKELILYAGTNIANPFLENLPENLTTLNFSDSHITDENLNCLAHLKNLTKLTLERCHNITDVGLENLSNLHTLKHLNLNGILIIDTGLQSLSSLTKLDLSSTDITDEVLQNLPSNLTELLLTRCKRLTDQGILTLANKCKKLTKLDLKDCSLITDIGIKHMAQSCKALIHLDLNGCTRVSDTGILAIAQNCKDLSSLLLSECTLVTDRSISAIAQNKKLTNVALSKTGITDNGITALVQNCPDLTFLSLWGCTQLPLYGSLELKNLPKLKNLYLPDKTYLDTQEKITKYFDSVSRHHK